MMYTIYGVLFELFSDLDIAGRQSGPRMRTRLGVVRYNRYAFRTQQSWFNTHTTITTNIKMLGFVLLVFAFGAIKCEPETVRDNFDYFNYGANEDVLKNLDLHLVSKTVLGCFKQFIISSCTNVL